MDRIDRICWHAVCMFEFYSFKILAMKEYMEMGASLVYLMVWDGDVHVLSWREDWM